MSRFALPGNIRHVPKVEFIEQQKAISVECDPATQTLLDASLACGLPHFHACSGQARCSTCRVLVIEGLEGLGPRTAAEAELAAHRRWPDEIRLACQCRPSAPARVRRVVHDAVDVDLTRSEISGWPAAEEKQLGLLFCDISGFTTIAEGQLVYDLVHSLNRFFKQMGDPILANHGVINKYLGDGLLALFGLDNASPEECARHCVRAGLRMLSAAQNLNRYLERHFGFTFEPRIGMHFGPVLVGQLGHPDRIDFTVIGDAVNTASRIEALNKTHGTKLLASEDLIAPILPSLETGCSFETPVRGRSGKVRLYEILGFLESDPVFLVQSTFELIAPNADAFATVFYQHLFAISPAIEALFARTEMATMRHMLMRMISVTVRGLHNLTKVLPDIRNLGTRHYHYGVREEHFDLAEAALLHALEVQLGEAFRPEVRSGWREVFDLIRRTMISGFALARAEGKVSTESPNHAPS